MENSRTQPPSATRGGFRTPPHLDAISDHPYAISGPTRRAQNADDTAIPDVGKLVRVLRAARRIGHVVSAGTPQVWVTEFSWDSSPPDPEGVPTARQARWL